MSIATSSVQTLDRDYNKKVKSRQSSILDKDKEVSTAISLRKEFSVASAFAKTLKSSLTPDMSSICESYLSTKLTAKFRSLAKYAEGRSGFRSFYLTRFAKKLKGFDFNSSAPFRKVFKAKYYVKSGSRKGQVILHFPAFIPSKETKAPDGATNFKISARLIALSDFSFDNSAKAYRQLNKEYHGRYASFDSGMLPILKMPVDPITTQLCFDQKELPDNTTLFLLMSMSFYTFEKGRFRHLNKKSSMCLEQVF